jgi:phosphatidate cytidylyltransferase
VPFSFFHALAFVNGHFNFHFPLAFLLMLWTNDTGAYLSGRFLGRTKLFERHSPKKTWEGFIGGALLTIGTATLLSHYFSDVHWRQWASMAVYISLVGTFGDLVESMFKRSINIKDSGGILPGHGGLLDRFDGLLLSAPLVFAFLYLFFI